MESDAYAYTGNAIRPEMQVVCNGKVLAKDTDYRVIYKDNQDIGTAEVTIHGIGEYIGNITIRFQIYCGHNNMLPYRRKSHLYRSRKSGILVL